MKKFLIRIYWAKQDQVRITKKNVTAADESEALNAGEPTENELELMSDYHLLNWLCEEVPNPYATVI
jgi:hypothetical protein